jgi:hypothetical protein
MVTRYHYLTLWYQPTLAEGSAEPFAVLVESHADEHREIFGILKHLAGDSESVTGQVLANLPQVLTERIYAAAERTDGLIIDTLRSELAWNIYADKPEAVDREQTTLRKVAYGLFAERVDVDRAQLSRFRKQHIDQPGDTFETQYTIGLMA